MLTTMSVTEPLLENTLLEGPLTGTILVVDDNDDTRQATVDVLAMEGFNALSASDGPSALAMLDELSPDVILMDVMMPGMTGTEVLQAIRARADTLETPVILITMLDRPDDIVYGLELGANDYLTKPVQAEVLVARVRTQLKLKRLQDQRRRDIIRLAELDTIRDKFLQIAAHDLKNPINNLMMGLDLLDLNVSKIGEMVREFPTVYAAMRVATNTMMVIVSDFLDHDTIRSGKIELSPQPVSLNLIVEQTVEQFQLNAERKKITLSADLDASLGEIQADPNRLMQVVSNLVGNGLKFTKSGGQVAVRTYASGDMQRMEVTDTGPGIREDEMGMLFQDFARLSNRATGGEKSSGLGLSIARRLVEMHGGRIGADSTPGQGSTFWFELPG
jgi:signal transduction histidine kinase